MKSEYAHVCEYVYGVWFESYVVSVHRVTYTGNVISPSRSDQDWTRTNLHECCLPV